MLVHIYGAKCIGIDAYKVTVEVDITSGIGIHLCGLADVAVKESLLRTVTALQSLDYHIPGKKIVINLAPADLQKSGSGYDLPIAVGIIAASGQRNLPGIKSTLIMGELGLDGSVRSIRGGLPFADFASKEGFKACILPYESAMEACEMESIAVYGVKNLSEVIEILEGNGNTDRYLVNGLTDRYSSIAGFNNEQIDFADIIGQNAAKRAMEIATAGGHNVIMIGAPGSGKSSIAKAAAGILPPLSKEEAFLCRKICSVAGKDLSSGFPDHARPFRAPHHSASLAAMIGGGGKDNIIPGEVTLAHNGVLFLDEFNLMPRSIIEALRAPLEDRKVTISRLKYKIEYPASFMLIAAANPCPCGYYGEKGRCTCTPSQRIQYFNRLSGPIMDRMDLQVWIHPVTPDQIRADRHAETSAVIAGRVSAARERQRARFVGCGITCNSEMGNKMIERLCPLSDECQNTLNQLIESTGMSMRAYYRIIKVARTIADLDGEEDIKERHLLEASGYRFLDRIKERT